MPIVQTPVTGSEGLQIYVEVDSAPQPESDWDDEVREKRGEKAVAIARDLVGDGVELARTCAERFSVGLAQLPDHVPVPSEVQLQLGITLDSEVGAVLAKARASAQLQVTMTWKPGGSS